MNWVALTLHLKMDGWKMKSPFGRACFQVRTVSFREGTLLISATATRPAIGLVHEAYYNPCATG